MEKTGRSAAEHYVWGQGCDGWHFVKRDDLSVIAEKMPPHTEEEAHFHRRSRQFFYILRGRAVMRFSDREVVLEEGEGIEIPPEEPHQMTNPTDGETEFIVVSMPKSHGDRESVDL